MKGSAYVQSQIIGSPSNIVPKEMSERRTGFPVLKWTKYGRYHDEVKNIYVNNTANLCTWLTGKYE